VPFCAGNVSDAALLRAALLASRRLRHADAHNRPRASTLVARAPQRGVTARPMAGHPARRRADASSATVLSAGHVGPNASSGRVGLPGGVKASRMVDG
jgi:hypothetical protein